MLAGSASDPPRSAMALLGSPSWLSALNVSDPAQTSTPTWPCGVVGPSPMKVLAVAPLRVKVPLAATIRLPSPVIVPAAPPKAVFAPTRRSTGDAEVAPSWTVCGRVNPAAVFKASRLRNDPGPAEAGLKSTLYVPGTLVAPFPKVIGRRVDFAGQGQRAALVQVGAELNRAGERIIEAADRPGAGGSGAVDLEDGAAAEDLAAPVAVVAGGVEPFGGAAGPVARGRAGARAEVAFQGDLPGGVPVVARGRIADP